MAEAIRVLVHLNLFGAFVALVQLFGNEWAECDKRIRITLLNGALHLHTDRCSWRMRKIEVHRILACCNNAGFSNTTYTWCATLAVCYPARSLSPHPFIFIHGKICLLNALQNSGKAVGGHTVACLNAKPLTCRPIRVFTLSLALSLSACRCAVLDND